jgi:hypothetical protein
MQWFSNRSALHALTQRACGDYVADAIETVLYHHVANLKLSADQDAEVMARVSELRAELLDTEANQRWPPNA